MKIRIRYNSPVVLTFAFLSAIVLLIDPQATLCSFGANKTMTDAELTMILDGHAERQAKNRE